MTDQLTQAIARIRELLPKVSEGPWERMEYGKQILPYNVATTDGHYNSVQCLIARGTPTGGNGWPASSGTPLAEKVANAELICLLRNNAEAIVEALSQQPAKPATNYKDRVRMEKQELDEKIERLKAFLESGHSLQDDERTRMEHQFRTMCIYSQILGERIAAFTAPPQCEVPPAKRIILKSETIVTTEPAMGVTAVSDPVNTPPPATAPAPVTPDSPADPALEVRLTAAGGQ